MLKRHDKYAEGIGDNLPSIQVKAGELHTIATEAEAALIEAGVPFYIRSGGVCRPIIDEVVAAKNRKTKIARLATISVDVMLDYLSRVARWEKWNARAAKWVPTDPPRSTAATILSRDGEWTFRPLTGVITTPTLRPDGSILDRPGYDPATRLLLLDPPALPNMPMRPSRSDALAALKVLSNLLADFSFVDAASRSVGLSGLITPVVRGAMPVAPLHAARSPSPGSGKSYLVDLASAIATGQYCPVIAGAEDDAENEKRLGAALMAGYPIISLDNLNGVLGGDALCQAIERPVVSIRVLGFSELRRIESRATLFATGNNIQPTGDVVRRVLLCSLDPGVERPELRQFTGDPLGAILADRGKYIAAALTMCRAYLLAGCPQAKPPLNSFDDWSRIVRSTLCWLGCADPVDTIETARLEDPEVANFSAVLCEWSIAFNASGEHLTTGTLKARAEIHDGLNQALIEVAGTRGMIDAKRLGHYLGRRVGRIAGGLKLCCETDAKRKQKRWFLTRL